AAEAHRDSEIELLLFGRKIEAAERHDAAIGELHDGVVNAGSALAFSTGAPVGLAVARRRVPRLSIVAADVQARAGFVAIERENEEALARADGLIAHFRLGLEHAPLAPRRAAVSRSPHDIA